MDKEVLNKLKKADWKEIMRRLAKYTEFKVNKVKWQCDIPPLGLTSEDIVEDAIVDVFDGTRRHWNPSKNPDLYCYLESVVDSKVKNLLKNKEYLLTALPTRTDEQNGENHLDKIESGTDYEGGASKPFPDPEEALLNKGERIEIEKKVKIVFESIEGNKKLEELVICIIDGYSKPSEIAKKLGVSVTDIYNREKRFRHKFEEIRNKIIERQETNGILSKSKKSDDEG